MNLFDLLIILACIFALVRGAQIGLLNVLFSIVTTIVGLTVGSWLGQVIAQFAYTEMSRTIIVVGFAASGAIILSEAGIRLAKHLTKKTAELKLDKVNAVGGAALQLVFTLLLVWLVSPAMTNIESANIGRQVRQSSIIGGLQNRLGHPPDVFAQIARSISPNGFPNVFVLEEPALQAPAPPTDLDPNVIEKARQSVVRIEGLGCGGVVNGSGWVVSPGVVVTNAHVVSGISAPNVVQSGRNLRATAVLFDPDLDLAVLRVNSLDLPALPLYEPLLADSSPGAIIGFPGGGRQVVSPSVVIDNVIATGRNIYNRDRIQRQIYEISADVQQGDSGGPLITETGSVAGIVFGKSVSQSGVGYAITMRQALPSIRQAESSRTAVSTGRCTTE